MNIYNNGGGYIMGNIVQQPLMTKETEKNIMLILARKLQQEGLISNEILSKLKTKIEKS
jgi:hypothetical protein